VELGVGVEELERLGVRRRRSGEPVEGGEKACERGAVEVK